MCAVEYAVKRLVSGTHFPILVCLQLSTLCRAIDDIYLPLTAYLPADLTARREVRVYIRVSKRRARMAAMTPARSPALSCWVVVDPAMTFAAVISQSRSPLEGTEGQGR